MHNSFTLAIQQCLNTLNDQAPRQSLRTIAAQADLFVAKALVRGLSSQLRDLPLRFKLDLLQIADLCFCTANPAILVAAVKRMLPTLVDYAGRSVQVIKERVLALDGAQSWADRPLSSWMEWEFSELLFLLLSRWAATFKLVEDATLAVCMDKVKRQGVEPSTEWTYSSCSFLRKTWEALEDDTHSEPTVRLLTDKLKYFQERAGTNPRAAQIKLAICECLKYFDFWREIRAQPKPSPTLTHCDSMSALHLDCEELTRSDEEDSNEDALRAKAAEYQATAAQYKDALHKLQPECLLAIEKREEARLAVAAEQAANAKLQASYSEATESIQAMRKANTFLFAELEVEKQHAEGLEATCKELGVLLTDLSDATQVLARLTNAVKRSEASLPLIDPFASNGLLYSDPSASITYSINVQLQKCYLTLAVSSTRSISISCAKLPTGFSLVKKLNESAPGVFKAVFQLDGVPHENPLILVAQAGNWSRVLALPLSIASFLQKADTDYIYHWCELAKFASSRQVEPVQMETLAVHLADTFTFTFTNELSSLFGAALGSAYIVCKCTHLPGGLKIEVRCADSELRASLLTMLVELVDNILKDCFK